MYQVCVVTGTRAEYGLLKPVILELMKISELDVRIVVTGAHLCRQFGYTADEIVKDGFAISAEIPCVIGGNTNVEMTKSAAAAMVGFADYFAQTPPDMVVLLGDRYEIFACAAAAAMARIPIAHLYGGDSTEGAMDEFFRHAISKMSYLHFVSNEQSRRRVIQLGEAPARVFNFGATGIENILKIRLLTKAELEQSIGIHFEKPYAVVTFHPVTMEQNSAAGQCEQLFAALAATDNMQFLFTKANADAEGSIINKKIDAFVADQSNCVAFESLGTLRYLSAVKHAKMVIGNSSSGIYEAPALKIPTVNIGDRQKGRMQAASVINCPPERQAIFEAMQTALSMDIRAALAKSENPYQGKQPSADIARTIAETLRHNDINLAKKFYDVEGRLE